MIKFRSYRYFIFLSSLYIVSLCLLLSWAEDSPDLLNLNQVNVTENLTSDDANNVDSISDITIGDSDVEQSVVQSSFEEVVPNIDQAFSHSELGSADAVSQNAGIPNEITDTGQALVFTLADTATAELQQRADIPSAITSHNETPNLMVTNTSKLHTFTEAEVQVQNLTADTASEEISDQTNEKTEKIELDTINAELKKENETASTEDIPSFSEWTQKRLEEAEKEKELVNSSSHTSHVSSKSSGSGKVRSKNYASLDCGAKIVAVNPEAASSSAVLSPSRDEYMLNACTNRIWFIVELCEAVQAKKIDLANFELFSSLPKNFSIYISDRFPTRDWLSVGYFTANEERDVQTYDLHPQLFGKYVKFEMHSYYGSEHFCPISLFRVYGTSEFEVLEKENQANLALEEDDEDGDEAMDAEDGQGPKNLFSSATDAVMSIVKKAAEVLGNKGNNSNHTDEVQRKPRPQPIVKVVGNKCKTPSHLLVCDNCSDTLYDEVYGLLSCKAVLLYNMLQCDLIQRTIFQTDTCAEYGLNFRSKRANISRLYEQYIRTLFSKRYLAALCNTAAIIDSKVVLNTSKQFPNITQEVPKDLDVVTEAVEIHTIITNKTEEIQPTEELTIDKIKLETSIPNEHNISYTSQIKPTKTLTPDDHINTHLSAENIEDIKTLQPTESLEETHENSTDANVDSVEIDENISEYEVTTETPEDVNLIIDSSPSGSNTNSAHSVPNTTPQAKETVILRLSNRIKALEANMSLSSQYLEELSRRYKKQVEEIQKLLDKTIVTLSDEGKKHDEQIQKLENQIGELTVAVQMLVDEKNNWKTTTYWLFLIVVVVCCIFTFCGKKESKQRGAIGKDIKIQRRKSIDVVNHNEPAKKIRRASEEVLKLTSGTYKDLMKDDADLRNRVRERKRKRKKSAISRSNSIGTLAEEISEHESSAKTVNSDTALLYQDTDTSTSKSWKRQESSPANFSDWEANRINSDIEDIPFVLDESENSPLESLPVAKPLEPEVKPNGNISSQNTKNAPIFVKTAHEIRSKRKQNVNGGLANSKKEKNNRRKSDSLDESARRASPTPSAGTGSLNISYDEVKRVASPKKDRKGAVKRFLKKVFPSDI